MNNWPGMKTILNKVLIFLLAALTVAVAYDDLRLREYKGNAERRILLLQGQWEIQQGLIDALKTDLQSPIRLAAGYSGSRPEQLYLWRHLFTDYPGLPQITNGTSGVSLALSEEGLPYIIV